MIISYYAGTGLQQGLLAEDILGGIIDLTGATLLKMRIWPRPKENQALTATLAVGTGLQVDDADGGEFTATFAADTLEKGFYTYEVTATLADTTPVMIGRGEIDVLESLSDEEV